MNFADLRAELKKEIMPIYVLHGNDLFLINKAIELIKEHSHDVIVFDENANVEEINIASKTPSMFGDKRVIVVRSDTEIEGATRVNCDALPENLVVQLIQKQFREAGKNIDTKDVHFIARACGNNYARINNEIIKQVAYFDLSNIIQDKEYQIYEFGNMLVKNDLAGALKILEHLQIDEYSVFGSLVSTFKRLYYSLNTTTCPSKVLGCNPYAINYARRDGARLRTRIGDIYTEILELEYKIKTGLMSVQGAIGCAMLVCGDT